MGKYYVTNNPKWWIYSLQSMGVRKIIIYRYTPSYLTLTDFQISNRSRLATFFRFQKQPRGAFCEQVNPVCAARSDLPWMPLCVVFVSSASQLISGWANNWTFIWNTLVAPPAVEGWERDKAVACLWPTARAHTFLPPLLLLYSVPDRRRTQQ